MSIQGAMLETKSKAQAATDFAMSIDVEDYFQVWAFSDVISRESWDGYALRVEASTRRAIDLFARTNSKATFFCLGWVAEKCPSLIQAIVDNGHELASHGYDHTKVFDQTSEEFRADVAKTKKILENIAGIEVRGFRAAGFSIDQRTPWAHDVLAEEGYAYSSSSHPISHDHYGDPDAPTGPYFPTKSGVLELPVATSTVMKHRVTCAGGGWFRAAPYAMTRGLLNKSRRQRQGPTIFYFHPWEIDPDQPRINTASRARKFRHYLNLNTNEKKLERLLTDFSWGRIDQSATELQCRGGV